MKYFIQVFGCQMNESDSERARTMLAELGYKPTVHEHEANLIMVMACAVRQKAVDRIYGRAERWSSYRKNRPFITILTGCVLDADKTTLQRMFDYIFPTKDLIRLPELLKNKPIDPLASTPVALDEYFSITPSHQSTFQAFVPISSGCNKFCSYCAVPLTRGREISRAPNDVITEVRDLVQKGYREITLLGQNVNSYGWDFDGVSLNLPKKQVQIYKSGVEGRLIIQKRSVANAMNFPKLLETIANIDGKYWIRFITSHPYDMSDELIDVMAANPRITPYIHLAVQSGSNSVLKRMNRLYTTEHYRERINKIRQVIPSAVISTDIIVGFCSEIESDFKATEQLVRDVRFDVAYIAQYSPRPGNVAYNWPDDVTPTDKLKRFNHLNKTLTEIALANNQMLVGSEQEVLIERCQSAYCFGKTKGNKNIKVASRTDLTGKFILASVEKATAWSLNGKLIRVLG